MELVEAIDRELLRVYEYQYSEGLWTADELKEMTKPLQLALCKLVTTTECASQTDRAGEQCNEVGLVQLPDNAVTSELTSEAETNDNHDSILYPEGTK